ncbi:unnamed protein product [Rhizoctonia solani]|uniref:EF-hand domain-containing protein n=1 Tax=Rhizoctonia solani TaxID=456999 RepID=A0A8H3CD84_9AGAM|nr:unnamed protein product [Rhizoctonia solani]
MQAINKEVSVLSSATQRWEDTRDSLASALVNYLDSCTFLESALDFDYNNIKALASRIDSTLTSLQRDMTRQLAQSSSILARTRNKVAPVWSLPGEVLAEIFLNVVYRPENENMSMKGCLWLMYRRLHRLMAVCSVWRSVAMAQSQLWGTVPAICDPIKRLAVDLSVERSRGGALRLATILPMGGAPPFLLQVAIENASRLRALNVQGIELEQISDMISKLLRAGALGELSELSVRSYCHPQTSLKSKSIISAGSPEQQSFSRLIELLSVLRLGSTQIDWKTTAFSSRLVELHIQAVKLGNTDSDTHAFLLAISTANELRTLKLASIITYRPHVPVNWVMTKPPRIIFTKLQFLLLSDLHFDVLQSVLLAITPGSHHLRIDMWDSSFRTMRADFYITPDRIKINDMVSLLSHVRVDTLSFFRGSLKTIDPWLSGYELRKILEAIPGLKELKMNGWVFDENFCSSLGSPSTPDEHALPKLEVFNLIQSKIWHVEGFKSLVKYISARAMHVGGHIRGGGGDWVELKGDNDVVGWLRSTVPEFYLVNPKYCSPELKAIMTDVETILAQADSNEDGALDLGEFLLLMGERMNFGQKTDHELRDIFKRFDRDGSGTIERAELGKVVASLGDTLTDQEVGMIMREVDTDGDGRVSFEGGSHG